MVICQGVSTHTLSLVPPQYLKVITGARKSRESGAAVNLANDNAGDDPSFTTGLSRSTLLMLSLRSPGALPPIVCPRLTHRPRRDSLTVVDWHRRPSL